MSASTRGFFANSWISRRSVGVAPKASSKLSMISVSSPATRPSAQATHTSPLMIAKFCSCIVRVRSIARVLLSRKTHPPKYSMTIDHYDARRTVPQRSRGGLVRLLCVVGLWAGCTAQAVEGDPPTPDENDDGMGGTATGGTAGANNGGGTMGGSS